MERRTARALAGGSGENSYPDPLRGTRVLDLARGRADLVTRLWADLGADVLKIETPGSSERVHSTPTVNGHSLPYLLHNANKRITVLDPAGPSGRTQLEMLIATADIVVDSGDTDFGISCRELGDRYPSLVTMSVTDFGFEGPKAGWQATDAVLYALSTALSRSRSADGTPVLPPDGIASATAATQAAWAGLVAYYRRLRCGQGDHLDFSRYEAVLQSLDPPFGSQGQAAAARRSATARPRVHRKPQDPYPIFACRDGWVRLCVLAPRQWRGLRAWLGEPEAFQDPAYDSISTRFAAFDEIGRLVSALFATQTTDELVCAGAQFGVPTAAVITPPEALEAEHFQQTDAFTTLEVAPDTVLAAPAGALHIDGVRVGLRWPAPAPEPEPRWTAPHPVTSPTEIEGTQRPFAGLRILDLGVIVAGGELGRLFSDLGADVIKVENPTYPDGLRQTRPGQLISESFAWTHRNQASLGVDLRQARGAEVFGKLVAQSDAVLANFKPGTLAALGFSYDRLRAINPGIVLAESSAYGDRGPWSTRMGYGPLVRASTGISSLWSTDAAQFCDSTTVFPDHVVARIAAIATLAILIRRERTGTGGHVHVSQAEAAIGQLAVTYTAEAARSSGYPVSVDDTVHEVLPTRGDDAWCVVSIRDDADWAAVTSVIGGLEDDTRLHRWPPARDELRKVLHDWSVDRDAAALAEDLQHAGVPAAPMYRAPDVLDDPHLEARGLYTDMVHPLLDAPLPTETRPACTGHIPPAELRPAPMLGEHTRQICGRLLDLAEAEIDQLITDGVLTEAPTPTLTPRSSA